jgi:hypothetical protein
MNQTVTGKYRTPEGKIKSYTILLNYNILSQASSPKGWQRHLRNYSEMPTFCLNCLALRNTTDVTGGKPIALCSQSILGVNAINAPHETN